MTLPGNTDKKEQHMSVRDLINRVIVEAREQRPLGVDLATACRALESAVVTAEEHAKVQAEAAALRRALEIAQLGGQAADCPVCGEDANKPHDGGCQIASALASDAGAVLLTRLAAAGQERDALRLVVDSVCPIGALDLVTSLRASKMHAMEAYAELERERDTLKESLAEIHATLHTDVQNKRIEAAERRRLAREQRIIALEMLCWALLWRDDAMCEDVDVDRSLAAVKRAFAELAALGEGR